MSIITLEEPLYEHLNATSTLKPDGRMRTMIMIYCRASRIATQGQRALLEKSCILRCLQASSLPVLHHIDNLQTITGLKYSNWLLKERNCRLRVFEYLYMCWCQ